MAASSVENDYVHLLFGKMESKGFNPYFMVKQASFWERNYTAPDILDKYTEDKNFKADLLIFRLGENVADVTEENYPVFLREFFVTLGRAVSIVLIFILPQSERGIVLVIFTLLLLNYISEYLVYSIERSYKNKTVAR